MREAVRNGMPVHSATGQRRDRRGLAVMLAALPHLVMAIVAGLGALFPARSDPSALVACAAPILMVVAFVIAWRRGWPLWSGSWAAYWLLFLFFLGGSLWPSWPGLEMVALMALFILGLILFQRRPRHGLLGSLPLLLVLPRFFVFELVAGGDFVWSGLWLLLAVTSGAIVWLDRPRTAILLAVAFQLLSGAAFALATAYLPFRFNQMGPRQPPSWEGLLNGSAPLTLAQIAIPLALLLVRPIHRLAMRSGSRGRAGWSMLLLGTVITMTSLLALRLHYRPLAGTATEAANVLASVGTGLGLGLSLAAAFLLASAGWQSGPRHRWELILPLLASAAPLVVFALPAPFAPVGRRSNGFQLQLYLSYGACLAWTCLALVSLLRSYGAPAEPAS